MDLFLWIILYYVKDYFFQLLSLLLSTLLVAVTYYQYKVINTPYLDSFLKTIPANLEVNHLDLYLSNSGSGTARDVEWVLLVQDSPSDFVSCCNKMSAYVISYNDRKYSGKLHSIRTSSKVRVKGKMPCGCKRPEDVSAYFYLYLSYKSLISYGLKKYYVFGFTSLGEQLSYKKTSKRDFRNALEIVSGWTKKLSSQ